MPVKQEKISPVEEGQKATTKNDRGLVEMDGVDQVHHASPKTELPEDGRDDDFFGFFGMDPLQDKATAECGIGEKAKNGPPY